MSEGAVWYHIDHFVTARVAPLTYGTDCLRPFDLFDPEHRRRASTPGKSLVRGLDGTLYLPNAFSTLVHKVWSTKLRVLGIVWNL